MRGNIFGCLTLVCLSGHANPSKYSLQDYKKSEDIDVHGVTEFGESEKEIERNNLLLLPPRNQNPNPTVATTIASTSLKQWSQNLYKVDSCSSK